MRCTNARDTPGRYILNVNSPSLNDLAFCGIVLDLTALVGGLMGHDGNYRMGVTGMDIGGCFLSAADAVEPILHMLGMVAFHVANGDRLLNGVLSAALPGGCHGSCVERAFRPAKLGEGFAR